MLLAAAPLLLHLVLRLTAAGNSSATAFTSSYLAVQPSGAGTASGQQRCATSSASSDRASLTAVRASLPDSPVLYLFQELAAATTQALTTAASRPPPWLCRTRASRRRFPWAARPLGNFSGVPGCGVKSALELEEGCVTAAREAKGTRIQPRPCHPRAPPQRHSARPLQC